MRYSHYSDRYGIHRKGRKVQPESGLDGNIKKKKSTTS